MLVLNRRLGESIVIADDIVVTVLECRGTRVKLGLVAPGQVDIYRRELVVRQLGGNAEAAQADSSS